jgi:hypothetical protein
MLKVENAQMEIWISVGAGASAYAEVFDLRICCEER